MRIRFLGKSQIRLVAYPAFSDSLENLIHRRLYQIQQVTSVFFRRYGGCQKRAGESMGVKVCDLCREQTPVLIVVPALPKPLEVCQRCDDDLLARLSAVNKTISATAAKLREEAIEQWKRDRSVAGGTSANQ